MQVNPRNRLIARARRVGFALVLVLATATGIRLSAQFRAVSDWTASGSNQLSAPTRELLNRLTGPVIVIVSARERSFTRTHVTNLLTPYQGAKSDIEFRFIDPRRLPARAARLGLDEPNEARIEYAGKVEHTATLTEQGITNALYRASQPNERWIASLSGHGERRILGRANHDIGLFGAELQARGFRPRDLNLAHSGVVPANSVLLVIASPSDDLLEAETDMVERYIAEGRNLLWIADPSDRTGQSKDYSVLATLLGVELLPGTVVAPHPMGVDNLSPTISLLARYPEHAITDGLDVITLFPTAAGFETAKNPGTFTATPFLRSSQKSWVETDALAAALSFDPSSETRGPVVLGLSLERTLGGPHRRQRIVVLGDADFLSNRYIANQGNLQLGLRIFDWLTETGDAISIPHASTIDGTLNLHGHGLQGLALFAFLGLPALLLGTGLVVRWRRQRR